MLLSYSILGVISYFADEDRIAAGPSLAVCSYTRERWQSLMKCVVIISSQGKLVDGS